MADERPRLAASEIEEELLAELQKLPTLRNTRSVTILPYSGPEGWRWKLDRIDPEVGPKQLAFVGVATVVGQAAAAIRPRSEPSAASLRMMTKRRNLQEETMRRFVVHFVTGIDFVDGDEASDDVVQNYKRHLAETVQDAAQNLSLRTIKGRPGRESPGRRNQG
jgi:hypothetical protein